MAEGSLASPMRTIDAALSYARQMRRTGKDEIVIQLAPGIFPINHSIFFGPADSGTAEAPFIIRGADPKQYSDQRSLLTGGKQISGFQLVEDPEILARLPIAAHGQVGYVHLPSMGVNDFGTLQRRGFTLDGRGSLKLFFNDRPMPLARWPNDGWAVTTGAQPGNNARTIKVDIDRERLERWKGEKDLWAFGYFWHGWADAHAKIESIDPDRQSITFTERDRYGYRDDRPFFIYNSLSELDAPGEWFLDRESGNLFFWPPEPLTDSTQIWVSLLSEPIIQMKEASHIVLENLNIAHGRDIGIRVEGGEGVAIRHCRIFLMDLRAVYLSGGVNHLIEHSHLHHLNDSGIVLNGGERRTLSPGGHKVSNNHIHDFALWSRTYNGAINIGGVGNVATHNLIHDTSHSAIRFRGNNHLISHNEIFRALKETDDAGVIYSGRDWAARGNVIENNLIYQSGMTYRLFHQKGEGMPVSRHFHSTALIYLDDMLSGITIRNNILQGVDRTIKVGGGRDNLVEGNIIMGGTKGIRLDARGLNWARSRSEPGGAFRMWERLEEVNYLDSPFKEAFPELAAIKNGNPYAPEGNVFRDNIFLNVETPIFFEHESADFITPENSIVRQNLRPDPLTLDKPGIEEFLRNQSTRIRGFPSIDLTKIGIQKESN